MKDALAPWHPRKAPQNNELQRLPGAKIKLQNTAPGVLNYMFLLIGGNPRNRYPVL
jgi:hypothetical protein